MHADTILPAELGQSFNTATATVIAPNSSSRERLPNALLITLSDGTEIDLARLSRPQLRNLQWREERAFADTIRNTPKGSRQRQVETARAYDTICTILHRAVDHAEGHLDMGYDRRYVQLVRDVLARQSRPASQAPRVFEVGFGSGTLLAGLDAAGVDISGIEVSTAMHREARGRLAHLGDEKLYLGDFLLAELPRSAFDVVFWNDVLEHVVTDEADDYLRKIHDMLRPGGALITITPNWHIRPSDVTCLYRPPRSEAVGFHMKEYTLREVTALLKRTGFSRVGTPLVVTRGRIRVCGQGCAGLKRWCEPALEWLPFRLSKLLCRGFGLSCTIGWK